MYVRMLHIYVRNRPFYTRISNEKRCFLTNITSFKTKLYSIFKEKGAICQMVPFCHQILCFSQTKGSICHVAPFNLNIFYNSSIFLPM